MARAAFLDRDGVLNQAIVRDGRPYAPRRLEDFVVLPEASAAVRRLRDAGFLVIVATNQKDVGEGLLGRETLEAMHARLREAVPVDDIRVCTCVDECPCYKPNPGMLLDAARDWKIDLAASVMIGDRWRDIGAGRNAGCRTIFIDRGYAESLRHTPDLVATDLADAVAQLLDSSSTPCGKNP
ncbi:MAG: HAD family hydrolase [Alphaproteobacteria bacterium]|nr:HAD family hydrolase [Alphaproteobacteria bacterium]MCW5738709.1 HAD family hydrolase [Alphaproteobacteria bacterium]